MRFKFFIDFQTISHILRQETLAKTKSKTLPFIFFVVYFNCFSTSLQIFPSKFDQLWMSIGEIEIPCYDDLKVDVCTVFHRRS